MPRIPVLPREPRLPPEICTRGVADIMIMRAIVGFLGAWQQCGARCRRHKRCASPAVECFDRNIDEIRPTLEALARWRRLDGPRDPGEEAGPVGVLID